MRIHQNPEEGHISIDQELAITKLAKAVLRYFDLYDSGYSPDQHPRRLSGTPLCNVRVASLYLFFRTPRTAGLLHRLPVLPLEIPNTRPVR